MPGRSTFWVQLFEERGDLVRLGDRLPAHDLEDAMQTAAAMVPIVVGTAALSIMVDDETGEVHSATILSTYGAVPDDFAESLEGE